MRPYQERILSWKPFCRLCRRIWDIGADGKVLGSKKIKLYLFIRDSRCDCQHIALAGAYPSCGSGWDGAGKDWPEAGRTGQQEGGPEPLTMRQDMPLPIWRMDWTLTMSPSCRRKSMAKAWMVWSEDSLRCVRSPGSPRRWIFMSLEWLALFMPAAYLRLSLPAIINHQMHPKAAIISR